MKLWRGAASPAFLFLLFWVAGCAPSGEPSTAASSAVTVPPRLESGRGSTDLAQEAQEAQEVQPASQPEDATGEPSREPAPTATSEAPAGEPASPDLERPDLTAPDLVVPAGSSIATAGPVAPEPSAAPDPVPTSTPSPAATGPPPSSTVPPRPTVPITPEEVARGDPSRPWVSLVFNAGAGFEPAPAILDVLRRKGVRTTFFLMGWWAEKVPDLVLRMAADGHEIASHGHRVFDLTAVSDAEIVADLEQAEATIAAITGRTTRPLWSPSAGYRDGRVRSIAASLGYRPIYWTVDSSDWQREATADGVRGRVLRGAVNGAIVVMHFDSPRSADTVAGMLPGLIDALRADGYRLVTISELITGHLAEGTGS